MSPHSTPSSDATSFRKIATCHRADLRFLGIFVGAWASCAVFCWYIHRYLAPIFDANNGLFPNPEDRLRPAPIAAVCIPIAMFG